MVRETRKNLGTLEPEALPIDDYDALTGAEAIAAVKELDGSEDVRVVLAYEQAQGTKDGRGRGREAADRVR